MKKFAIVAALLLATQQASAFSLFGESVSDLKKASTPVCEFDANSIITCKEDVKKPAVCEDSNTNNCLTAAGDTSKIKIRKERFFWDDKTVLMTKWKPSVIDLRVYLTRVGTKKTPVKDLSFTGKNLPSGMTLTSQGLLTGKPDHVSKGVMAITVAFGEGEDTLEIDYGVQEGAMTAINVAAGGGHSCIVDREKEVWCWGLGASGQLSGEPIEATASPVKVPLTKPAIKVVAGLNHTCAMTEDHHVACWGSNRNHQINESNMEIVKMPYEIQGVFDDVVVGATHTCVVGNKQVMCWGENHRGQIGNGNVSKFENKTIVNGIADPKLIAAGGNTTCAINQADELFCWGDGNSKQLGDAFNGNVSMPIKIASNVSSIAMADAHICGIVEKQAVCWGNNVIHQLGVSATNIAVSLTSAMNTKGNIVADRMIAGGFQSCAMNGTQLSCWGSNGNGQLGAGDRSDKGLIDVKPVPEAFTSVSMGKYHACGITTKQEVKCWGQNEYLQTGISDKVDQKLPAFAAYVN